MPERDPIEQVQPYCENATSWDRRHGLRLVKVHTFEDLIRAEIDRSRFIYDLRDDFDGEGSKGYSKETWTRAKNYLHVLIDEAKEFPLFALAVPRISPGPNGSIDILWETTNYRCLVNIPEDENIHATYYGEGKGGSKLEGSFPLSQANLGVLRALSGT